MRTSHWILFAAAAVVVALLYFWRDPGAESPPERNITSIEPMLGPWIEAGELDIEIVRGAETLRLECVAPGAWKLVEPVEWPVSLDYCERLIQGLWLTVSADPSKSPDPGSIDFASKGEQITLSRGATRVLVVRIGPDVGFESYAFAQIPGDDDLWKAPLALAGALREPLDVIRSRLLLGVPRHLIAEFRIERSDGAQWSAKRFASSWRRVEPADAPLAEFDVRDLLVPWVTLEAAEFVDDRPENLALYGLDPPVGTVRFRLDAGTADPANAPAEPSEAAWVELRVGAEAPDGGRYVGVPEWNAVVRVVEPILEWLEVSSDDIIDRRVFDINMGTVVRVTIERDAPTLEFTRSAEDPWHLEKPVAMLANADEVNLVTDALSRIEITDDDTLDPETVGTTYQVRMQQSGGSVLGFDASPLAGDGDRFVVRTIPGGRVGTTSREALAFLDTPHYVLRDPEITAVTAERLGGLRIHGNGQTNELIFSQAGWFRRDPSSGEEERVDNDFMAILAKRWTRIRAKEYFATTENPPEWLDPERPHATIELVGRPFESNDVIARLEVFWRDEGEGRRELPVARKSGEPYLFRISTDPVSRLKRACPFLSD